MPFTYHLDSSFTAENVSTVLATFMDIEKLKDVLLVRPRKLEETQQQSSTVAQQKEALIDYYIKFSEWASWADLANSLYHGDYHEAAATAKTFIKQTPGKN